MSLPNALQRRALLYGGGGTDFAAEAHKYMRAEEHSDTLEFALRIEDDAKRGEVLRELRDLAQRQGNWFLLNRMHRAEAVPDDVWRKAFDAAKSAGRLHYALKIAKRLGDADAVGALELELGLRQPEPEVSGVGAVVEAKPAEAPATPDETKSDADEPKG